MPSRPNEYGAPGSYMDAYHRDLDWAPSGTDVPHHFVVTVLYEVPRFGGDPIARRGALAAGGSACSQTLQSGAPFTVITAANTTNAFPAGPLRPDLVGDPELPPDERTLEPLVRYRGVREPGAVHLRQLAAIGAAGPGAGDDGPDAREVDPPSRDASGSTCAPKPSTC